MAARFKSSMAWRAVLLGVLAVAMFAVPAQAATAYHYSGEATGVQVTAFTGTPVAIDLTLAHAGPLPLAGGSDVEEVLNANVALPLSGFNLSASVIRAETEGAGSTAQSVATVSDLALGLTHLLNLQATTLQAIATATCGNHGPELSGRSVIEDLVINGIDVSALATGQPNQPVVTLGPVQLFFNEQTVIRSADGQYGEITVTALRIRVTDPALGFLGEIVLSQAQADVRCPGNAAPPVIDPVGDIGGPCGDPAYYGIFDNRNSTVAVLFRFQWRNMSGVLRTVEKTVPAGAYFRTTQKLVKPFTTIRVSYFDPATGHWVILKTLKSDNSDNPPCVYPPGFHP